jgi:hypothetical protein
MRAELAMVKLQSCRRLQSTPTGAPTSDGAVGRADIFVTLLLDPVIPVLLWRLLPVAWPGFAKRQSAILAAPVQPRLVDTFV